MTVQYPLKKRWKTSIKVWLFFSFCLGLRGSVSAWSYPLKTISKGNLTELPLIQNADYAQFKGDPDYRTAYSVLRTASYYGGRDVGMGAHEGVDFATDIGTSVYASYDGEIFSAWYQGNRGNTVVIKHERNGEIYYTIYAHLSAIYVTKGQTVKEGDILGASGDTGNTTWPHLHFQIEKENAPFHPYYPTNCQGSIEEVVNTTTCTSKIIEYTLDPIYFLEVTSKREQKSDPQSYFINAGNLSFSWFLGGFMTPEDVQRMEISKIEKDGTFLSSDLTISYAWKPVSITPSTIKALGDKRQVMFQTQGVTWFTIITIEYDGQKLVEFPILINTKEGIEKWKSNPLLCELLEKYFNLSCN